MLDWLPAETRMGDAPVIAINDDITVSVLAGEYDLQIALVNDLGEAKIKLAIDMPQEKRFIADSRELKTKTAVSGKVTSPNTTFHKLPFSCQIILFYHHSGKVFRS
ncbi:hypothetical protein [Aliivibrio logei]|uniref:hypothetical protein n=1 Tax=Aliivibrio logei TaxID=688 RepID=UPI0035C92ADE